MNTKLTAKIDDYCTYAARAVRYFKENDYPGAAINCRKAAEAACKVVIYNAYPEKLADTKLNGKSLKELILLLIHEGMTERKAINTLETLQIIGNKAAHDNPIGKEETVYAINGLNLFNEYLFKECLKINPPKQLDFNISEQKEKIVHKEIIKETIVQEKFNKEAEEQIFTQLKTIREKNEADTQRFESLKQEIELSHKKLEELSKQKAQESAEPLPKKNIFLRRRAAFVISGLGLGGCVILFSLLKSSFAGKDTEAAYKIAKHPDSVYVAINRIQIMQDNPSLDFKIEDALLGHINSLSTVNGLPIRVVLTSYKGGAGAFDSVLIERAATSGFDLVYYGNLYETALSDSNILEINGYVTRKDNRMCRDSKIKFKTLSDSTFIKEINDQSNFPLIHYFIEHQYDKSNKRFLQVLNGLRTYDLEALVAKKSLMGTLKYNTGDYPGSLEDINFVMRHIPPTAHYFTYKANLLGTLDQLDSARIYFDKALQADSTHAHTLICYGMMCFDVGDYPKAERLAQKAALISPKDHTPLALLARIKMRQVQYSLAKSYGLKANALFSGDAANSLNLATVYAFIENKKDSAELFFRQALGQDSSNAEALSELAGYYQRFYSQEYKQKIAYLLDKAKALRTQNNQRLDYNLGCAAFEQRDFKNAIKYFEKVYSSAPQKIDLLTCMAQCYYWLNEQQKALEFAKKAVLLDSTNGTNLTVYASLLSYITPKDFKTCTYYFEKALRANSSPLADIYQQYGTYLTTQGKVQQGIDLCLKGHKLFPTDTRLNSLLAYSYYALKKYRQAKPYLEFLVLHYPNNDTLLSDLSYCILSNFNGAMDETYAYGISLIKKALNIKPDNPTYLLIYSIYLLRSGNSDLAIEIYLRAKDLSKNLIYNEELETLAYQKIMEVKQTKKK